MAADTILLVSADNDRVLAARTVLDPLGHEVVSATDGAAAIAALGRERVDLVLVDESIPAAMRAAVLAALAVHDPLAQALPLVSASSLAFLVGSALRTRAQLAHLNTAERLKGELLASVSHELRSPLNVVIGYVELLREGAFGACSTDALAALGRVHGNAVHLLELVEEFLDLSRTEAQRAPGAQVALTPFLREVAESFTVLLRTKPVAFQAEIPNDLPTVLAEPAKLRVVVQNLLSNAEKFTEEGRISLEAQVIPGERVAIRVSDTGPGIPVEHHEAIFGLFHQLGDDLARSKGIGLGLALARRFARIMGGDITVESRPGRGSTFTLVLEAARAAEPVMRPPA
jgi:signal transduction histidine kinase